MFGPRQLVYHSSEILSCMEDMTCIVQVCEFSVDQTEGRDGNSQRLTLHPITHQRDSARLDSGVWSH